MSDEAAARLARYVRALPAAFPGPGGAIAVLRRGEVLMRHAWGYANAERRLAFTPRSLVRICSVTKQLVCAALLAARSDPETLAPALRARLPHLAGPLPTIAQLCHNQSGLRDYWAVAMLLGAGAEDPFGDTEAVRLIGATQFTSCRWRKEFGGLKTDEAKRLKELERDRASGSPAVPELLARAWLGKAVSDLAL